MFSDFGDSYRIYRACELVQKFRVVQKNPSSIRVAGTRWILIMTLVLGRVKTLKSWLQVNASAVRSQSACPTCERSSPLDATWAPPSAPPPATPSGRRTGRAWTRRAGRRIASAAATSAPPSLLSALPSQPVDLTARDKGE